MSTQLQHSHYFISYLIPGHIIGPIICHTFCNFMGFPEFGLVLSYPSITRRIVVSLLYVVGLVSFFYLLFPLTETSFYSNNAYPWWHMELYALNQSMNFVRLDSKWVIPRMGALSISSWISPVGSLGGALTFCFGINVWLEGPKRGACERTILPNLGPLWTEHLTKCSFVNWILARFEAMELNYLLILRHWRLKFLKKCVRGENRVLRTEKCWYGGLVNVQEGMKRGSSGLHKPVPHFLGSAFPRGWEPCSLCCSVCVYYYYGCCWSCCNFRSFFCS